MNSIKFLKELADDLIYKTKQSYIEWNLNFCFDFILVMIKLYLISKNSFLNFLIKFIQESLFHFIPFNLFNYFNLYLLCVIFASNFKKILINCLN